MPQIPDMEPSKLNAPLRIFVPTCWVGYLAKIQGRACLPMKVLPTKFRGTEYRSKTEAMWAAYFYFLNVPFVYEPDTYDLGESGCYIPDFYLPNLDCFVEIKPDVIIEGRESPCYALAEDSGKTVFLIHGRPQVYNFDEGHKDTPYCYAPGEGEDFPHWPCICEKCGTFGFTFEGRTGRLSCNCTKSDKGYNHDDKRLHNAVKYSIKATTWKP